MCIIIVKICIFLHFVKPIKKTLKNASAKDEEEFDGYHESEREDLDRLINSVE